VQVVHKNNENCDANEKAETNNSFKTVDETIETRSSATAKSTARPSCSVGVLYDIYRETINRSTANQPLLRN